MSKPQTVTVTLTKDQFNILISMWTIAPLENMGRPKAHTKVLNDWLDSTAQQFGYKDAEDADMLSPGVPESEYP